MDRGCRLHGLVRKEGDYWVSIVLDYDVIGTGDNPQDAIRTSVELAVSYVKAQLDAGKELSEIRQPAPLHYRLQYRLLRAMTSVRARPGGPTDRRTFEESVPAFAC